MRQGWREDGVLRLSCQAWNGKRWREEVWLWLEHEAAVVGKGGGDRRKVCAEHADVDMVNAVISEKC